MNPKMVIGYTGFGKRLLQSPFSKQLTLSDRNMIQQLSSMSSYNIKGQLYENTKSSVIRYTVPHESVTIDRHISNKGYFSS